MPPDGEKIALLRKKRGLTQAQLAELTQLNLEDIQRMEAGQNKTPEKLQLVAMELLKTTDVSAILKNDDTLATDPVIFRFDITVKVSTSPSQFEEIKDNWLRTLADAIVAQFAIALKSATPGESTLVELEMAEPDIDRMISSFWFGRLNRIPEGNQVLLDVVLIRIGSRTEMNFGIHTAYFDIGSDGSVRLQSDEIMSDDTRVTVGWQFRDFLYYLKGYNDARFTIRSLEVLFKKQMSPIETK